MYWRRRPQADISQQQNSCCCCWSISYSAILRSRSPWYNRAGWLGVKHKTYLLTYLLTPLSRRLTALTCDSTWVNSFLYLGFDVGCHIQVSIDDMHPKIVDRSEVDRLICGSPTWRWSISATFLKSWRPTEQDFGLVVIQLECFPSRRRHEAVPSSFWTLCSPLCGLFQTTNAF